MEPGKASSAAQSTLANHLRRASNRTLILYTRNAKPASPTSKVSRARAVLSESALEMTRWRSEMNSNPRFRSFRQQRAESFRVRPRLGATQAKSCAEPLSCRTAQASLRESHLLRTARPRVVP
jgi:hypothetical protein